MTVSLKPMDPEDLWFMCSKNQLLFQARWMIHWTPTHTTEQVVVFMRNWYPDFPTMDRSTIRTTHQSTWRSRRQQGGHQLIKMSSHLTVAGMEGGHLLLWFWIMQVIPSIVQYSRSVWTYSITLSGMDALTPLRIMSPIIVKKLRISNNVLLTLLLMSQINLSGLNIWLIAFHARIIPFNKQLEWCALIQTICSTIMRQCQVC